MRLRFTKMHGAGNDFVVLDGTSAPIELSRVWRALRVPLPSAVNVLAEYSTSEKRRLRNAQLAAN